MTTISLWAPFANRVTLIALGEDKPMISMDGGHWQLESATLEPGVDYSFSVDDGTPMPDPRSAYQPQGVHGPSQLWNHQGYRWVHRDFRAMPLHAGILYELHVGTFSKEGTFVGALKHLDHLHTLGITHLELMPIGEFPGRRGWGYDGVQIYAPFHRYGTPDDLKKFVDACHGMGIAVILDVVYNHLGPEGNYLQHFAPYFTSATPTPWGASVNLDGPHSLEVRRYFLENALMWLRDYRFDGLRLDAIDAFHDNSACHFVEELTGAVETLQVEMARPLVVIGESDRNDARVIQPREAGGFGLSAQWSDDFHHALHAYLTNERTGYYVDFGSLNDVAKACDEGFINRGEYRKYRMQRHGRPSPKPQLDRLITYIQNHDQVGNRPKGERLHQLVGTESVKLAAAIALLLPSIPMLFQGEEWAASAPFLYFTHFHDPKIAQSVKYGRIVDGMDLGFAAEDVADPQAPATFAASALEWSEIEEANHAEILAWYRALITFRKEAPGLWQRPAIEYSQDPPWFVLRRPQTLLWCNFSSKRLHFDVANNYQVALTSDRRARLKEAKLTLPGQSAAVLVV